MCIKIFTSSLTSWYRFCRDFNIILLGRRLLKEVYYYNKFCLLMTVKMFVTEKQLTEKYAYHRVLMARYEYMVNASLLIVLS